MQSGLPDNSQLAKNTAASVSSRRAGTKPPPRRTRAASTPRRGAGSWSAGGWRASSPHRMLPSSTWCASAAAAAAAAAVAAGVAAGAKSLARTGATRQCRATSRGMRRGRSRRKRRRPQLPKWRGSGRQVLHQRAHWRAAAAPAAVAAPQLQEGVAGQGAGLAALRSEAAKLMYSFRQKRPAAGEILPSQRSQSAGRAAQGREANSTKRIANTAAGART